MILVDTSIWIDHQRMANSFLFKYLEEEAVITHPFVIGELAMGTLKQRGEILHYMQELPQTVIAYDEEVLRFVASYKLFGTGISYIDAHLLVAVQLTDFARFWTRDKRLLAITERLGLAWTEPKPS